MDEAERTKRVREYVRQRLQAEVAAEKRGYQAKLCREMKLTSAHMSNALSADKTRGVGEVFARKAAKHWGITYAELERLALNEAPPEPVPPPERSPALMDVEEIRTILRAELEAMRQEDRDRSDSRAPVRPRKAR